MKKLLLCSLTLLLSMSLVAQTDDVQTDGPKDMAIHLNEVKLNVLFMVIGAVDVTYERILNEESGVGLEVFIPFDEDIKDNINYYVSPYYRLYFGNKHAGGFFLEGFGMLSSSVVNEIITFNNDFDIESIDTIDETNFALGIGVGGKWYTNSGFVGEINLGVGRNLLSSDYDYDFVGKVGITAGYRF